MVLSAVQTFNGSDFVTTRKTATTASGFEITMQEEEALNSGGHATETLGWIALEAGTGRDGSMAWAAGRAGGVTDAANVISYGTDLGAGAQAVASLASLNGVDPAWARGASSSATGFTASVEEDTSADAETAHIAETLDFLAFNQTGVITVYNDDLFVT